MRFRIILAVGSGLLALAALAAAQTVTVAALNDGAAPDLGSPTIVNHGAPAKSHSSLVALHETALGRAAATALFVNSNPQRARLLAARALQRDPRDAEALFVSMEAAAQQADIPAMLDAAVRLCEVGYAARREVRVLVAANRLYEAANTTEFGQVAPRIPRLLSQTAGVWPELNEALLKAALDGAAGLNAYAIAGAAGVLTDWRIVGPLPVNPTGDPQAAEVSPHDDLSRASYGNRAVESFQFPGGVIRLPDYLARPGVFYAVSQFAGPTAGNWTLRLQSLGDAEVFVDGTWVLQSASSQDFIAGNSANLDLAPGPHFVTLRFRSAATAIRVVIAPTVDSSSLPVRGKRPIQEMRYLTMSESLRATQHPDMPSRLAVHPRCEALKTSAEFYRSHSLPAEAKQALQQLQGCAPESLDYAQALSEQGHHREAAAALQELLEKAPLNRAARVMLIRELQLAGDGPAAQKAAAEWMKVAPNASSYRRLARYATTSDASARPAGEFYQPYRRDATTLLPHESDGTLAATPTLLLEDRVAVMRPDGSVSLYVHTATQIGAAADSEGPLNREREPGAQFLQSRVLHRDGTWQALEPNSPADTPPSESVTQGDVIDQEYVLNYTGDHGIEDHPEVFQFVFGPEGSVAESTRFVVLTPADFAEQGIVIANGDVPRMQLQVSAGMMARIWEHTRAATKQARQSLAIVRVVQRDNGWTVPSKAEHQRRLETIHPGPRLEEAALRRSPTARQ